MTRVMQWKEPGCIAVDVKLPRMHPDSGPRRRRWIAALLPVAAMALALLVGVLPAGAASSVEGVWAFESGEIAVTPLPNGTSVGPVVDQTNSPECVTPVGEKT